MEYEIVQRERSFRHQSLTQDRSKIGRILAVKRHLRQCGRQRQPAGGNTRCAPSSRKQTIVHQTLLAMFCWAQVCLSLWSYGIVEVLVKHLAGTIPKSNLNDSIRDYISLHVSLFVYDLQTCAGVVPVTVGLTQHKTILASLNIIMTKDLLSETHCRATARLNATVGTVLVVN